MSLASSPAAPEGQARGGQRRPVVGDSTRIANNSPVDDPLLRFDALSLDGNESASQTSFGPSRGAPVTHLTFNLVSVTDGSSFNVDATNEGGEPRAHTESPPTGRDRGAARSPPPTTTDVRASVHVSNTPLAANPATTHRASSQPRPLSVPSACRGGAPPSDPARGVGAAEPSVSVINSGLPRGPINVGPRQVLVGTGPPLLTTTYGAVSDSEGDGYDVDRHEHVEEADPAYRGKWYTVTAGRAVGVYKDWEQVSALTTGVSRNSQKSYRSHAEAEAQYRAAKENGFVFVRR